MDVYKHLFAITLFNDTVINLEHVAINVFTIVNNKLDKMGKEAVVAYFEILSRHLP
jgi:hypothetical protein